MCRTGVACAGRDDPAQPAAAAGQPAPHVWLPDSDLDEKSRIVVLTLNGVSVGVVVDAVSEVLRVSNPAWIRCPRSWRAKAIWPRSHSICRLNNGKRLVSIMTARNLFDHSAISPLFRRQ